MLYLMQHGAAYGKEMDPRRPLTDRGAEEVESVAIFLARARVPVTMIFQSGKLRAEQTADILAEHLTPNRQSEEMEDLGPTDPTESIARELWEWSDGILLVSHMPFVGRLTGALITGDEHRPPVAFLPGSVAALERAGDGRWLVAWMVRPELLR